MRLYHARMIIRTDRGARAAALQDFDGSFHITLQKSDNIRYEHFQQVQSKEDLLNHIQGMEDAMMESDNTPLLPEVSQNETN